MTLRRWEFANAGSSFAFFDMLYAVFYVVYVKVSGSLLLVNIFGAIAASLMLVYKTLVLATLSSFARGLLFARTGQPAKFAKIVAMVMYALVAVSCVLAVAYMGIALYIGFGNIGYRGNFLSWQLHGNRLYAVPNILIFVGSIASLGASGFIFTKVKTEYPTLKKVRPRFLPRPSPFVQAARHEPSLTPRSQASSTSRRRSSSSSAPSTSSSRLACSLRSRRRPSPRTASRTCRSSATSSAPSPGS